MSNPIQHSDIVQQGNPFKEAIAGAIEFRSVLENTVTGVLMHVKKGISEISAANINTKAGQDQIERLSVEMMQYRAEIDALRKSEADLVSKINQLTSAGNNYKKAVSKLSEEEKIRLKLAELQAKELAALPGTYAKLDASIKRASFEQKNFTEKGSAEFKILGEQIVKATSELKKYKSVDVANQTLQTKTSLNAQHTDQIRRENAEMLAGAKRVMAEHISDEKRREQAIERDNARMLAGAKRVMAEYKKEQADVLSSKASIGSQRAKAYASTDEYKTQLMYQKLLKRENEALAGSVDQLRARLARVTFEMNKMSVMGSDGYRKLQAEAKELNAQIKKQEASYGVFSRNVGNYISSIRNAWLGYVVAFSGAFYTIKKWVNLNAQLSDSMAAVRRTTGMTQKEVFDLNETLRGFNTRTAQASLLDLAHVAGKLGIAKDQIVGFVKAADMIGVALGKDIGNNEEAINQLGRIVKIFNVDSNGIGMEKALLKIGSALKDLGNASVAEEINIIDFTKRLGGIASAAKVSVDKIMALAATYDILGQTMEVSSTATSQIWIAMIQKTRQFAQIAGMSVEDFTDLMKKDFVEAFIAFVEGLSKYKGGMEELGNYFEGLGLDGRRIIGVMTVLSGHVSTFRDQMRISKKSLDEGRTASEQFAIQNSTLAASIDKIVKSLQNLVVNSGAVNALSKAFNWLGTEVRDMSDWLSNDKLNQLNLELRHYKEYYGEAINDAYQNGKPFSQMWVNYYEGQIVRVESLIKAEQDRRKEEERITSELKAQRNLTDEMDTLLSNTDRYNNFFGGPDWKMKAPKESPNLVAQTSQGTMPNVPQVPPPQDQVRKYMKWRIDINAATIDEIVRYEMGELARQGILEQATAAEIAQAERRIRLDALQKITSDEDKHLEFRIGINKASIDEMLKYERDKLVEQGIWGRANATERAEWEQKERISIEEKLAESVTSEWNIAYNNRIATAKANGKETYEIEREMYNISLRVLEMFNLEGTNLYQQTLNKRIELDNDYTAKIEGNRRKINEAAIKIKDDTATLTIENNISETTNALALLDAQIEAIKAKKVKGHNGMVGIDLTPEDNAELDRLLSQRNNLIDNRVSSQISLLELKLSEIDGQQLWLRWNGWLTPDQEKQIEQQRRKLALQIEELKIAGDSDKNKTTKDFYGNVPVSPVQEFFRPAQWQQDLQTILGYVQEFANNVNSILNSISQKYQQEQEAQLSSAEQRYEKEYDALDKMVSNKLISEEVAAARRSAIEKKKKAEEDRISREYARKQQNIAYTQAVINTALSVTNALATAGNIYAGIAMAAVALATGLYEISVISDQKFEKGGHGEVGVIDKKKGGVLQGKSHRQGGIQIPGVGEAQGGEYFAIINREATMRYSDQLPVLFDAINGQRYEQMFSKRGITMLNVNVNDKYGKQMLDEMKKPKTQTIVYDEGDFVIHQSGNYRLKISKQ